MRPSDPGFHAFAAALDRYLTPPDALVDDAAPCACCRIESTDLDAHGLCPSCVEPDEDDRAELLAGSPEPDRAELLAGSPEPDRADHEGPRPMVFDVAAALAGTVAA